MHRGGCLELYYCNMVEWSWWDSSLIWKTNWFPSVLWHCWFHHHHHHHHRHPRISSRRKSWNKTSGPLWPVKIVPDMIYNVFGGTLNLAQSISYIKYIVLIVIFVSYE